MAVADDAYRRRVWLGDGHREARDKRNDNDGSPFGALSMSANDPRDEGVANVVLDHRALDLRARDKELVLDVDKVLAHLNALEVGILDRVLNRLARAQAPRSGAAADLHLARSRELEFVKLLRRKVGRGDEEGELALVVLVAQQEVPALREVTAQVSRWLADELEASVVPGHAREASTVKEVLARLRQVAPFGDALVGIVLTRPDVSFSAILSRRTKEVLGAGIGAGALVVVSIDVVYENVSRGIVTSEAEVEAAGGQDGKRCPH